MNINHIGKIARELGLKPRQVEATADLLDDGATVPFISRYRKEATGLLDEVNVAAIRDRQEQLVELDKRREAILQSLAERDLLTDDLKEQIDAAETMSVLEDIYLPYRPKRRTRATIAREKGLEPLALLILAQGNIDPFVEAGAFVSEENGVASVDEALAGARDIIAEMASEDQQARTAMRNLYAHRSEIASSVAKGKEEEGAKYKDYFDWREPITKAPSHRVLAMMRGENEGFLRLKVSPPEEAAMNVMCDLFVRGNGRSSEQVRQAVDDSFKRLLGPSMETETRNELKRCADETAIRVFAANLRELLLSAPLGQKRVLALDPGFKTGCKLVCMDSQGKLIHHQTVYPHTGAAKADESSGILRALCKKFAVEVIAIGNGTAGRETEAWVRSVGLTSNIPIVMVNESGASIYSASAVAREEFPDQDVTVRGSVSIGRRLMDPLAELVKIDPKSIGVGQYQHDVDQPALKKSLDDVVESCVNGVGVDVNTASRQLLTYVSGLGLGLAKNIVSHRDANGPFKSRRQLLKVKGLGPKAYEQAAGFLRIRDAENPLDASAVHPESYHIVDRMSLDLGCKVTDLMANPTLRKQVSPDKYISDKIGLPTLRDIMDELAQPGRDPRERFEVFQFADGIEKIEDLSPGMKLPGIITNVTAFGAFVDIGVHQDGLVHVSQLADKYVSDPNEVVKAGQRVQVTVTSIDIPRKRIGLSMKENPVF